MKYFRLLFLVFLLASCQLKKTESIVGTWYHLGLYATENHFYNESEWQIQKVKFVQQIDSPSLVSRPDYYIKLELTADSTFTETLVDLAKDTALELGTKGKWQFVSEGLNGSAFKLFMTSAEKDVDERTFRLNAHENNSLETTIIQQLYKQKDSIILNYNLFEKQKRFEALIKMIGIDTNSVLSETWDFHNFGKYQILTDYMLPMHYNEDSNSILQYNEIIQSVIYTTGIWDNVPYYQPIFESTNQRLQIGKHDSMNIVYGMISSRSGDCGTLARGYYNGQCHLNVKENSLQFVFDPIKNPFPIEVKGLFWFQKPKAVYNYKILAKNKAVMILEASNND
jgi:hypothetical protein